jgi:hypothetical protein
MFDGLRVFEPRMDTENTDELGWCNVRERRGSTRAGMIDGLGILEPRMNTEHTDELGWCNFREGEVPPEPGCLMGFVFLNHG